MEGLKRFAANNGIPVSEEVQKVEEGWEGEPKGLLQVLWERGFINSENIAKQLKDYTIKHRKDQYGIIDIRFSLTHLMLTCTDFEEEKIILLTMGHQMGIEVDCTPKCHPELAGEGIELLGLTVKTTFTTSSWTEIEAGKILRFVLVKAYHEKYQQQHWLENSQSV
jgi:hypothetical protein